MLQDAYSGRKSAKGLSTSTKLWLGFGTLTLLLGLSTAVTLFRLGSIRKDVDLTTNIARPRSGAARELEIHVLAYVLAVHEYLHDGDAQFQAEAVKSAAKVEQFRTQYLDLIQTDQQRAAAEKFDKLWKDLQAEGQTLLQSDQRTPTRGTMAKFSRLRHAMEQHLNEELQAPAFAEEIASRDVTHLNVRSAVTFVLLALAAGVVIAILTGGIVSRGIVRNEHRLWENRELLRVTLASIGDGVVVTDKRGRVLYINTISESLTGWTQAEAAGQPLENVFRIISEETRELVENPVTRSLREGVIIGLANHTILIAKDGTERAIDDSAAPMRDEFDQVVGCVLIFRDISQRRKDELQLVERARLTALRADISSALAQSSGSAEALRQCAQALVHYLDVALARIWTLNGSNQTLDLQASAGLDTEVAGSQSQLPWGDLHIGRIARSGQPLLMNDLPHDPTVGDQECTVPEGIVAFAGYPLIVSGEVMGVMAMFGERPFTASLVAELGPITDGIAEFVHRKRVSESLQASEERYRGLFGATPTGVFLCDQNGVIQDYNPRAAALWGREPKRGDPTERFCGSPKLFLPDGTPLPHEQSPMVEVLRTGVNIEGVEVIIERLDGSRIWVIVNFAALKNDLGKVVGAITCFQDISQRKRDEEAVLQSEARKASILETALDCIITMDHAGNVVEFNPAAEKTFGYRRAEVVGRPLAEMLIPPTMRARHYQGMAHFLATGEAPILGKRIELPALRADGTEFPAELSIMRIPMEGPALFTAQLRDISERKRAEQLSRFLADVTARLSEMVDYTSTLQRVASISVPAFADWCAAELVDPEGTWRLAGVAHSDPEIVQLSREIWERYPHRPTDTQGSARVIQTRQAELIDVVTEAMLVTNAHDAEHLRMLRRLGLKSSICVPLVLRGTILGVLTFATDQSGRRYEDADLLVAQELAHRAAVALDNASLYVALQRSDRRKDEFLATLAHELRNPLAPIRNGLRIMKRAGGNPEEIEETRAMMERQVGQMVRLVDDLLDVSRISRNKLELRRARIELESVVTSAVETSRPLIERNRHELTLSLPSEPVYLQADMTRLAQVFSNLLTNAAKYTPHGGKINLAAAIEGGQVAVRVRDNGVGISADMLPRVFEIFTQVEDSLKNSQGGLGIGLTLVRRLVELHGGTVEANSAGAGQGSEFVVRLPVSAQTAPEPVAPAEVQPSAAPKKRRILVVDDNKDSALTLGALLRLTGHEIRTAHDGLEAVEAAENFGPEVVVLDIGLPKLNGYDACRQMRQQPGGAKRVMIALTGWGQEEDKRKAAAAGFDHHLVKPVDPIALDKLLEGI